MGIGCPRSRCRRSVRWRTALTQELSDLPGREDGEKAGEARTDCKDCQLALVELGNVLDRHVQLAGQGFDGSLVCGAVVRMRGRGQTGHISLSSDEHVPVLQRRGEGNGDLLIVLAAWQVRRF
jgi:hypothetical protein